VPGGWGRGGGLTAEGWGRVEELYPQPPVLIRRSVERRRLLLWGRGSAWRVGGGDDSRGGGGRNLYRQPPVLICSERPEGGGDLVGTGTEKCLGNCMCGRGGGGGGSESRRLYNDYIAIGR